MSAEELAAAVRRLFGHVSHWTPPRWAASSMSGASRGQVVFELIQRLADLAAAAEGEPSRPVPRLETAMPDQLRVVAADLIAAEPGNAVLAEAAELVNRVHRTL